MFFNAKPFLCRSAYDFYWLGHVPCRIVKLVGLVVGIQIYEKKILYTGISSVIYSLVSSDFQFR